MSFKRNIRCHFGRCSVVLSGQNIRLQMRFVATENSANAVEGTKMQSKNIIFNQWKLINHLRNYFSNSNIFENVLNKEISQLLQKIQPSLYGKELYRYLETKTKALQSEDKNDAKPSSNVFLNVLNGIKYSIGAGEDAQKVIIPKWKLERTTVGQEIIASKITELLLSLVNVTSQEAKLVKLEELCLHLRKYSGAKHIAVKKGALRMLLKLRQQTKKNLAIQSCLNEALSLLGYSDPVACGGIRILSIDGGGVRGILVIEMLKKLEEYSGKRIYELFDLICGVSTGAIIANLVCVKQKSLDEILEIYRRISTQVFSQSSFKGTSNLVFSHSYYDTKLWESLLRKDLGEEILIKTRRNLKCPKLCTVSALVNQKRLSAYLFRNYTLPCRVQPQYMGSSEHKVWEAVRASAAAPTYFEEFILGNMLHQDGGVLINNPTAVAIHEAKLIWPTTPLQCVISFGTGRTAPNPVDFHGESLPVTISTWRNKFIAILESATDTEGVHAILNDLLPENLYYRFNPYLTEMLDIAEIDPGKLEQLRRDAVMYLRRNEDKFKEAADVLNRPKSKSQKILDWLNLQKEIHGFNIG